MKYTTTVWTCSSILSYTYEAEEVVDCAKQEGVDPQAFGIPSDLKGFTQESKAVTSNTDPRFKRLFAALRDNVEITVLRTTLHYLCENKYNTDLEMLKSLFQ